MRRIWPFIDDVAALRCDQRNCRDDIGATRPHAVHNHLITDLNGRLNVAG
jgi:hypothetical protein